MSFLGSLVLRKALLFRMRVSHARFVGKRRLFWLDFCMVHTRPYYCNNDLIRYTIQKESANVHVANNIKIVPIRAF